MCLKKRYFGQAPPRPNAVQSRRRQVECGGLLC
ncbi:MAG: hypothetical protein JWQ10_3449, partial [Herbaspirillum sp.]|nr:hypothetical protein [Herbaspirillum sp.]